MSDLKNLNRPLRVGVILVDAVTEILDVAPLDIFNSISKHFVKNFPDHMLTDKMRGEALDIDFHWVNELGKPAKLTAGATIQPTHTFETCPPLDITLMGAHDMGYMLTEGEKKFIQKCNTESAALLFICGGYIAALQAGILEGKRATAPRPLVPLMQQSNPEVNWVTKRWTKDGKIWTTGALLNGTDMTAAFVTEVWGGEGSLVEFGLRLGGYPVRDVDYADVPWAL